MTSPLDARVLTYRLFYGPALLVKRLFVRDGFEVIGPTTPRSGRTCTLQVATGSEGREGRADEIVRRWAPDSYRLTVDAAGRS
ncbi:MULTISPECIES: hypothetical protein [unclassified Nocardioides]|uniref:hypothetical protein n=1 Tax=unclassified Nocardioides TaxID=2615069 RepID=UPI003014988C